MTKHSASIVVAGHVCLDIIPTFPSHKMSDTARIQPGQLYLMGPAVCATGGAVSNTGLALHHLGVSTTLMGKVADDLFGTAILDILRSYHPGLVEGMIVALGENTSYSIVISPPDLDRAFLHSPGANDTFHASDVQLKPLQGASLFHFGYPPLMKNFFTDGGLQLGELFRQLQSQQLITSLDMSLPDPQSPAGGIDWVAWLARVLPAVDLYLPSIEETLFMLDRQLYDSLLHRNASGSDKAIQDEFHDPQLLGRLSEQLLDLGAAVVVLKIGKQGLYLLSANRGLRVGTDAPDPGLMPAGRTQNDWLQRELMAPCFEVEVAGTTGAGDSTIAGLLAAIVGGAGPSEAMVQAVAVGACSVEAADATSGIRDVSEVWKRIYSGWKRRTNAPPKKGWTWDKSWGIWQGPGDART